MKKPDTKCICCARLMPYHSFAPGSVICNPCSIMAPQDIAIMTRNTIERQNAIRAETAAGRREVRQLLKMEEYAKAGKRCSACHHYKLPEHFGACASRGDGLQANCKGCNKLRLTIVESGLGLSTWHQTRNALRSTATGPLSQSE